MWTQWTSEKLLLYSQSSRVRPTIIFYIRQCTLRVKKNKLFCENKVQRKNRILKTGIQPLMESGIHGCRIRNPQCGIRIPRLSLGDSSFKREHKKTGGGPAPPTPSKASLKIIVTFKLALDGVNLFQDTPSFTGLQGFESGKFIDGNIVH